MIKCQSILNDQMRALAGSVKLMVTGATSQSGAFAQSSTSLTIDSTCHKAPCEYSSCLNTQLHCLALSALGYWLMLGYLCWTSDHLHPAVCPALIYLLAAGRMPLQTCRYHHGQAGHLSADECQL